ncbi:MAG: hypothetical protein ACFE0Q_02025 [Anaerolineae bacterium]
MPEKKHGNPFENHINSDSFDVSKLGSVSQRAELERDVQAIIDNLPDTFDQALWDHDLDMRQEAISMYVTNALIERIQREGDPAILADFNREQLAEILSVPVIIGMVAQKQLQPPPAPKPETSTAPIINRTHGYRDDFSELPANWGDILNEWFLKAKDFLISLFRRT